MRIAGSEKAQCSLTDPKNRILKTGTEGLQHYNDAQLAVEAKRQPGVAAEVGQNAKEQGGLVRMVDRVEGDS